jgi:hypothetical protein
MEVIFAMIVGTEMHCDHCGKETRKEICSVDYITWCSICVNENLNLLNSLSLVSKPNGPVVLYHKRVYPDSSATWYYPENITKLRAVPKKNTIQANKIAVCKVCNTTNQYAVANQTDGSYLCYDCRV